MAKTSKTAKLLPSMKLFVLAGEASGDKIGADLIGKLRTKVKLNLFGIGGDNMIQQGLVSKFPITDLSVMGIVDVIFRLPLLLLRVRQTINFILQTQPDIVVLIDSQVFSNLVAKGLLKKRFKQPVLLYVSPSVWAYKPSRAKKIKPLYAEILAILPFEPAVLKSLGGPKCTYVGHPALQNFSKKTPPQNSDTIILMPGSREGELRRHLPMFAKVVQNLHSSYPELKFSILTLPHLSKKIFAASKDWNAPVNIITRIKEREQELKRAKLAICVAGTATLELAMVKVPMVVCYVMDSAQRAVNKSLQVKRFSLPNLILEQDLLPDLLMESPDIDLLESKVLDLLNDQKNIDLQLLGFAKVMEKMEAGEEQYPRNDPAEIVLSHMNFTKK